MNKDGDPYHHPRLTNSEIERYEKDLSSPDQRVRDEAADKLFMHLEPIALRCAYRMLGDAAKAEDIVNTKIATLFLDDSHRSFGHLQASLLAAVNHACIDVLRADARHMLVDTDVGDLASTIKDHEPDALAELIRKENAEQLHHALGDLSPLDREILWRHIVEGETFAEIGKDFDLSAPTIHYHFKKTIDQLKKALKKGGVHA